MACMAGDRGSPRMLRAPKALGPNSMRPWNQPTTLPSASSPATCSSKLVLVGEIAARMPLARDKNRAIWSVVKLGPRKLPCWASRPSGWRGLSRSWCQTNRAAPERAAGIAGRRLDPEVVEVAFAEQPAVGHAVQRHAAGQDQVLQPGPGLHVAADPEHDFLGHGLDAGGQVHVPLLQGRLGRARRTAEEAVKPPIGHRQPLAVVEIVHVEPEAAVGLQVDQALEDQVPVDRPAVGGQAHQLVFTAVDLEAAVVGERRIQQAQRVGKRDVVDQADTVALADVRRWPCSTRRLRRE